MSGLFIFAGRGGRGGRRCRIGLRLRFGLGLGGGLLVSVRVLRLAATTAVVGDVPTGPFELQGGRGEQAIEKFSAILVDFQRVGGELLDLLKNQTTRRTLIFVKRHFSPLNARNATERRPVFWLSLGTPPRSCGLNLNLTSSARSGCGGASSRADFCPNSVRAAADPSGRRPPAQPPSPPPRWPSSATGPRLWAGAKARLQAPCHRRCPPAAGLRPRERWG